MYLVSLLESLGASVSLMPERADSTVDAVLEVSMDGVATRFAVETKGRAPYPSEVRSMTPIRERLEPIGLPLLVSAVRLRVTRGDLVRCNVVLGRRIWEC